MPKVVDIPIPLGTEFVPIPGFPGYKIARNGMVLGKYGRPMVAVPNLDGYLQVKLCVGGKTHTRQIHILLALTFVGPRPDGHQVRHLDGNRVNNSIENLCWGTTFRK